MKLLILPVFLLGSNASESADVEPEGDRISTRQVDDERFEITLDSRTVFDVPAATRRIVPTARELCGDRGVEFGHYTFDMNQAVRGSDSGDWFRLVQNIRCVDPGTREPPSGRTPQLENEEARDEVRSKVRVLSEDYFEQLYANMGDDAEAALAAIGGGDDADSSAVSETVPGTQFSTNLFRLTIYDNTPGAPADGIYVAVDYENRVGNVAHHCGYLMWHSFDAEHFELGRVESGAIGDNELGHMSESEVYAVRKQFRCANVYDK